MCTLLIAIIVVCAGVSACQRSGPAPYSDRQTLRAYGAQAPGVPVVLPMTLPSAYTFIGPGYQESKDGQLVLRTLDFRLGDASTAQVIEMCIIVSGSRADRCLPPGGRSEAVARTYRAHQVWIRPLGTDRLSAQERSFWTGVALSDDLDRITWLT